MLELSLHMLDIVENALNAGADMVEIYLEKNEEQDKLKMGVSDNGSGMSPEDLAKVTDPFYTTRTTRRVGLGIPLLKQAAEQCDGAFRIDSTQGRGTRLEANFKLSHIDRAPLGDMLGTLMTLIVGRPDVDLIYRQRVGHNDFIFDTREVKEVLEEISLSDPDVIAFLKSNISEGLAELGVI